MSDPGHVTMSACDPHVSVKDPVSPEHHRTHRLHASVRVWQTPSKTQCPPNITRHTGYTLQSESDRLCQRPGVSRTSPDTQVTRFSPSLTDSVKDPVSPEHHRTHRLHASVRVWQTPSKTQCPPNITGHTGYTLQSESDRLRQRPGVPRTSPDTQVTRFSPSLTDSVKDPVSPEHHRTHRLHASVRVWQTPSKTQCPPNITGHTGHASVRVWQTPSKTQCPPNITGHTGHTLQSESDRLRQRPGVPRTSPDTQVTRFSPSLTDSVKDPASPEHHRTHRSHASVRVWQTLSKTQCSPNITGHTGYTLQSESDRLCQRPSVPRTSPDTQVTRFSPSLTDSVKDPVFPEHHRTHRLHASVRVWQTLSKTQCSPNITGHTGYTLQSESDRQARLFIRTHSKTAQTVLCATCVFLYLFVLWLFAAHMLLNWWRWFINLLMLFLFACVFWRALWAAGQNSWNSENSSDCDN